MPASERPLTAGHLVERAAERLGLLRDAPGSGPADSATLSPPPPPPGSPTILPDPSPQGGSAPSPAPQAVPPPDDELCIPAPSGQAIELPPPLPEPPNQAVLPSPETQTGDVPATQPGAFPIGVDVLARVGMALGHQKRTRVSEEYRISAGRILRTMREMKSGRQAANLLMVSSARPGEGKSFSALNLAGSIALNGLGDVLLVDLDPKPHSLSAELGLSERQGFLDLLLDPTLSPDSLIVPTAVERLSILPVGTRTADAAALSGSRRGITQIERLGRSQPNRLVVLDAPPCLSSSDPSTFAPHVAQTLLVVEAERTQRDEVEAALDLVRDCPAITLMLNKVRLTMSHTFGAYDYLDRYA